MCFIRGAKELQFLSEVTSAQQWSAPGIMYAMVEDRYLAACRWLDELSDGHFSLLKAPLH